MGGNNISLAINSLKLADAVCFDVDSTVIQEESIDILAKHFCKHSEISSLTDQAMNGELTFHSALSSRLNILKPSKLDLMEFINHHSFRLSDNVKKLISVLH